MLFWSHFSLLNAVFTQVSYKAEHSQLTYLQLMSTKAVQNVTLHCRNTIGYYDPMTNNYRRGLKLLAFNDAEIMPKANNRLRYKALLDECQVINTVLSVYFFYIKVFLINCLKSCQCSRPFFVILTKRYLFAPQHKSQDWARTIVEYETDKPGRLPLLDVAIRDVGRPQQMFRVEIGLACFS